MIENYINKLFCKDNLELLKELPNNSIDLIYSDILYGTGVKFDDYQDLKINIKEKLIFDIIPETIYNHYWIRLIEMKRILKDTGSIYLQMDTRINHWIRIMMDMIFGYNNFHNEITWNYRFSPVSSSHFSKAHDIILFYSKSDTYTFNKINHLFDSSERTKSDWLKFADENGNVLMKDLPSSLKNSSIFIRSGRKDGDVGFNCLNGIPIDWWEIPTSVRGNNPEIKHGKYNTQKPERLLERIILASSNENDIVLDLYMGSGTSMVVAKKNNRKWIGCDINSKSIDLTNLRLNDIEDKSKQIEHKNKLFEF
jgi:site-specific DNA-methyltransferase (adenine-specific)